MHSNKVCEFFFSNFRGYRLSDNDNKVKVNTTAQHVDTIINITQKDNHVGTRNCRITIIIIKLSILKPQNKCRSGA